MTGQNFIGERFHSLTVVEEASPRVKVYDGRKHTTRRMTCQCVCGTVKDYRLADLKNGGSKSCGCLRDEVSRARGKPIIIGKKFNMLTLLKEMPRDPIRITSPRRVWVRCDCGTEKEVSYYGVRAGVVKSCGCLQPIVASKNFKKHGLSQTRLNSIHKNMIQRCYNKNNKSYSDYGGRGIQVCLEWRGSNGFENFARWALTNGYQETLTLDREKNNKGYSPSNCRWSTTVIQANNKRSNIWVKTKSGHKMTFKQYHEKFGVVGYGTALHRLKKGWKLYAAITKPSNKQVALLRSDENEKLYELFKTTDVA